VLIKILMETDVTGQNGSPKTWWDCLRGDMDSFGLYNENAWDRDQRRLANLSSPGIKMAIKMVFACAHACMVCVKCTK